MADNVTLNSGSGGASCASDDIGGVQYQRVKIGVGADGSASDAIPVSNGLDTTAAGVLAAGLVGQLDDTATGTVTENQFAPVRISSRRALLVEGVASGTAVPVSSASLPLPSGASTAAKQPALGTAGSASTDVITIQGIASMTKLLVTPDSVALPANQSVNVAQLAGTATDTNSGTKSAGTLRVVLATDQPALTNKLLVTPDSVALPANQSVNISQINGVTPLMGAGNTGTGSHRVTIASDQAAVATTPAGNVAHDAADSGNPVKVGAKAETSPKGITLVADGDRSDLYCDADGILMVKTGTAFGDLISERVSNTDGASTAFSTFGAVASTRNYITQITVHNAHATTNGYVDIRDGTGGSVLYTIPAPATGGAVLHFNPPLRQPTANTALAYDVSAAISTVYISVNGFQSKA